MKSVKIAAWMLALMMLLCMNCSVFAAGGTFRDVAAGYWAYDAVERAFADRAVEGSYYDPATGEYGVDVVEVPGTAILATSLKEDSNVTNLGEVAGETYGNLSYLSVADWMPADLIHK